MSGHTGQEVCPFNVRFAEETEEEAYAPKPGFDGPTLVELAERLLPMSENQFLREYSDSPLSRARRKGLLRKVCTGLRNRLADEKEASENAVDEAVNVLVRALNDGRPLVRGYAAWALGEVVRGSGAPFGGEGSPRAGCSDPPTRRSDSVEASRSLSARLDVEEDGWAREEIEAALSDVE